MPTPVSQGDLDMLCSLYALMNLARLQRGAEDNPKDVASGDLLIEAHFFLRALRAISGDPDGDLLGVITEGLDVDDVVWLSARLGGPELTIRKPTVASINRALGQGEGVIVYFDSDDGFTHYSVVSEVDAPAGTVTLFDSWGFVSFKDGVLWRQEGQPAVRNVRLSEVLAG